MATNTPLVFYDTVPSLKNITSAFIAVRLWKEKVINGTFQEIFHRSPSQFAFDNSLPIPRELAHLINRYIGSVEREIEKWATYNEYYVFKSCKATFKVLKIYYDEVVWHPNGTIDDVQTARKMLLWPKVTILNDIVANTTSDESTLFSYWERYYEQMTHNGVSDSYYRQWFRHTFNWMVNRWTVIEFFFNRATSFERLQVASIIIKHRNSFYLKKVLGALNEEELKQVISEHADEIMICFLMCPDSRQVARQTWAYMKDKVQEKHFYKIIGWMLEIEASKRMNEDLVSLFVDIWTQSPDRLKQ